MNYQFNWLLTYLFKGRIIIEVMISSPETGWRLSRELQFFDTEQGSILVNWVIDVWQVFQSGSLSHSSELVVDRSVADANPTIICSEVRNGNTAQMSADCRADKHFSVSCLCEVDFFSFINNSLSWVFVVLLVHFLCGQSAYEDRGSVPHDLENLSRG